MVISCQMPELLQHADISHAKYQSVPNNKCTSCSFSDLPPCQQGSAGTPGRGELLLLPPAHSHGAGGAGGTGGAGGAGGAGAGIWVPRPHFAPWGLAKCDPGFWEAAPAPPRALLSVLVLTARINPSGCVIRIGGGPFDPISTVLPRLNVSGLQIDSEFYKHPDSGAGKAERREKLSAARSCWAAHGAARGWQQGQGEHSPTAGSPPFSGTPLFLAAWRGLQHAPCPLQAVVTAQDWCSAAGAAPWQHQDAAMRSPGQSSPTKLPRCSKPHHNPKRPLCSRAFFQTRNASRLFLQGFFLFFLMSCRSGS